MRGEREKEREKREKMQGKKKQSIMEEWKSREKKGC